MLIKGQACKDLSFECALPAGSTAPAPGVRPRSGRVSSSVTECNSGGLWGSRCSVVDQSGRRWMGVGR